MTTEGSEKGSRVSLSIKKYSRDRSHAQHDSHLSALLQESRGTECHLRLRHHPAAAEPQVSSSRVWVQLPFLGDEAVPTSVEVPDVLLDRLVYVSGYRPKDMPGKSLPRKSDGNCVAPGSNQLVYMAKAEVGMSGEPVWLGFRGGGDSCGHTVSLASLHFLPVRLTLFRFRLSKCPNIRIPSPSFCHSRITCSAAYSFRLTFVLNQQLWRLYRHPRRRSTKQRYTPKPRILAYRLRVAWHRLDSQIPPLRRLFDLHYAPTRASISDSRVPEDFRRSPFLSSYLFNKSSYRTV